MKVKYKYTRQIPSKYSIKRKRKKEQNPFVKLIPKNKVMFYSEFLQTDYWKAISTSIKKRVGECVDCGSKSDLQVHHIRYPKRFTEHENMFLLMCVCGKCHRKRHNM